MIVRLNPGASLAGRVLDSAGKPVAGARIQLGTVKNDPFGLRGDARATSSGDGSYRITSLTPGPIELTVVHANYPLTDAKTTVAAGTEGRLDIVMLKGGTVAGRVTVDGRPAPDQAVQVISTSMNFNSFDDDHRTDDTGRYTIAGIADGDVTVHAELEMNGVSRSRMEQATVKNGQVTQVDFNFVSGRSAIEGTIFQDEGVPLRESVHVSVSMTGTMPTEEFSTDSDENGRYVIEGLPAGQASLSVEMDESFKGMTVEIPERKRVRQDILLYGGATVRVRLIGGDEFSMMMPVILLAGKVDMSEMSIDALEIGAQPAGMAMAESGEAVFKGIEPGAYTIMTFRLDPSNIELIEETMSPGSFVTKVIEVKKDEELVVDLEL